MKHLLRKYIIDLVSLYLLSKAVAGVSIEGEFLRTLALAAGVLLLFGVAIKPILNALLLPIHMITLGMTKWLVGLLSLLFITFLVKDFTVNAFYFSGMSIANISIPEMEISKILAFVIAAILLKLMVGIFSWFLD